MSQLAETSVSVSPIVPEATIQCTNDRILTILVLDALYSLSTEYDKHKIIVRTLTYLFITTSTFIFSLPILQTSQ